QMSSAELPISSRSQLGLNQVALIGKKKQGRAVGRQVNTGPSSQFGDDVGLPNFSSSPGLKADKCPSGSRAVNKIISEKRSGGIAQNTSGAGWSVGPENFCRRVGLV